MTGATELAERQTRAILALRTDVARLSSQMEELVSRSESERQAHREAAAAARAQADLVGRSVEALAAPLRGRWGAMAAAGFLGLCLGLGLAGARELGEIAIGAALEQAAPR